MNWTGGVRRRLLPANRRENEVRQKKFFDHHAQHARTRSSNSHGGSFKVVGGQEHGKEGCNLGNVSTEVPAEGRQQLRKIATPDNQQDFQEHTGIPIQTQHLQKLMKDLRSRQKKELARNRRGYSAEVKNPSEQCLNIFTKEENQHLETVSNVKNSCILSSRRNVSNSYLCTSSSKTRESKSQDATLKPKISGCCTRSTKKGGSYGSDKFEFGYNKKHSMSSKGNYHSDRDLSSNIETTGHKTRSRLSLCRKLPSTYGAYSALMLQMELNALCKKHGKTEVPKIEGISTPYVSQKKNASCSIASKTEDENDGVGKVNLLKNDSLSKKEKSEKLHTEKDIFKASTGDHIKLKNQINHRQKLPERQRETSAQTQDLQTHRSSSCKSIHSSEKGISDSKSHERTATEDEVKTHESLKVNHSEKYTFHCHPEKRGLRHMFEVSDRDETQTLEHSEEKAEKPLRKRRLGLNKIFYVYQDQTPPVLEDTNGAHPQRVIHMKNNPHLVQRKDKTPYRESNVATPKWDTSLYSSSSKASSEFPGDSSRTPVYSTEETSSALSTTSSLSGGKSHNMEKCEQLLDKIENTDKCDNKIDQVKSMKVSVNSNSIEVASLDQNINIHSGRDKQTRSEILNMNKVQISELSSSQKEEMFLKRKLGLHSQDQMTPVVEGTNETQPQQVEHIRNNTNLVQDRYTTDYSEKSAAASRGLHSLVWDDSQCSSSSRTSSSFFSDISRMPVPTTSEKNLSSISPLFPTVKPHNTGVLKYAPDNIRKVSRDSVGKQNEKNMKRSMNCDQSTDMQSCQNMQTAISPILRRKIPSGRSTQWNSNGCGHHDISNRANYQVGITTHVEPDYDIHNEQRNDYFLEKSGYVKSNHIEQSKSKQWFIGQSEHLQGNDIHHGPYKRIKEEPGTRIYGYRQAKTIHNQNEHENNGFGKCIKENKYSLIGNQEILYIRQKKEAYVNERGDIYLREMESRCVEPGHVIYNNYSHQTRHSFIGLEESSIVFENKGTNAKPLNDEYFEFKEPENTEQRKNENFESMECEHEEGKENCSGSTTSSNVLRAPGVGTTTCGGPLSNLLVGSNSQDLSSQGTSVGPSPPTLVKTFADVMELTSFQPAEDLKQE